MKNDTSETDSAMKAALKAAVADDRKDTPEVEQITQDAGDDVLVATPNLPTATEQDENMVFENSESLRFALGQSANSLSYFGLRNLVWVAAITSLTFDELVSESDFGPAAEIAADYRAYFTRGDDTANYGVDGIAGSDEDGRSDLHSNDSMDSGTDSRKRLSEAQFDIMSQNADRYLACAAALARLREYGIEPTQPVADYKNDSGKVIPGTMTRVINWHRDYIANRQQKSEAQNKDKAVKISKATKELGASSLAAFGI